MPLNPSGKGKTKLMQNEIKSPSAIAQEIKAIAARLLELFPGPDTIHLNIGRNRSIEVGLHRLNSYEEATRFLQSLDISKRQKQVHDPNNPWCVLSGDLEDGLQITCFCDGLPPSCRKVKKIERVPKTQTVTTGDFVEIEREVIECGAEHENEPATSN